MYMYIYRHYMFHKYNVTIVNFNITLIGGFGAMNVRKLHLKENYFMIKGKSREIVSCV